MIEYRSGGRRVSQKKFFENLKRRAIDSAFAELERRAHGAASSIVDPATGKHPEVFVRRRGDEGIVLRTNGSPDYARELERRLGLDKGSVHSMAEPTEGVDPNLYLAHASEDHDTLAKPLAKRMMASGINVWLDDWEISAGDSLRQKMEEGLKNCSHFLVLLTPNSLGKAWVETEIDAGFIRAVEGKARFIGIRIGVEVSDLSPFLRTRRCPQVRLEDDAEINALIADIYGVSRKPPRGRRPKYVRTLPAGVSGWSHAAATVAEFLVLASKTGTHLDPQVNVAKTADATGLSEEDVRLGVLDLKDNGLIESSKTMGSNDFWPTIGLFVEFDRHFLDFDNQSDAISLATWLVSEGIERIKIAELVARRTDWSMRRLNSALNYLEDGKIVNAEKAMGQGPWTMSGLQVTDRTRRFVRDHG